MILFPFRVCRIVYSNWFSISSQIVSFLSALLFSIIFIFPFVSSCFDRFKQNRLFSSLFSLDNSFFSLFDSDQFKSRTFFLFSFFLTFPRLYLLLLVCFLFHFFLRFVDWTNRFPIALKTNLICIGDTFVRTMTRPFKTMCTHCIVHYTAKRAPVQQQCTYFPLICVKLPSKGKWRRNDDKNRNEWYNYNWKCINF